MSGTRAAIRYAKAVLALAQDQNAAEAVSKDMSLIANTVNGSKELQDVLKSPVITAEIKKSALLAVFPNSTKNTIDLVNTLITNNRLDMFGAVASKYVTLYNESIGNQTATVTTAVELSGDLETKVLAKVKELTGKAVIVNKIVDETILGGFILRVGDLQYDASIANQLNKLKREFTLN
jgi:F-type H+-transporting ATPase subunit delta